MFNVFGMMGSWKIENLKEIKLPEDVEKAFKAVTSRTMIRAINTPVLYCGHQVTKGTNYMIIYICQPIIDHILAEFYKNDRYLNQIIINSFEGEYSLVSSVQLIHEMDENLLTRISVSKQE